MFPLVLALSLPPWRTPHPFCLRAFARAAPHLLVPTVPRTLFCVVLGALGLDYLLT